MKSFVHALLDMADAGWFTSATLKQFIDEVQRKTQYTFSADAQRILQAWKPRNP